MQKEIITSMSVISKESTPELKIIEMPTDLGYNKLKQLHVADNCKIVLELEIKIYHDGAIVKGDKLDIKKAIENIFKKLCGEN